MGKSVHHSACGQYRDEILDYFCRRERTGRLSPPARQHYDHCVDCVEAVAADVVKTVGESAIFENGCSESDELRQVFTEWGVRLPPPQGQQK
jgi:hypothetical protein